MHPAIQKIKEVTKVSYDLARVNNLVNWDRQTYMPSQASEQHAESQATLLKLLHEAFVHPDVDEAIKAAEAVMDELSEIEKKIVTLSRRDYDKETKLPSDYYERRALAENRGYEAWLKAREANDISLFLPALEENIKIAREYSKLMGYDDNPYDAHLDYFEPGMTQAELDPLFDEIRDFLIPFVQSITSKSQGNQEILKRTYPLEGQQKFTHGVVKAMGFDLTRGRIDTTTHPFCSGFHPNDVRLTTRFLESEVMNSFTSSVHEAGHGLYEQNLPVEWYGTSLCSALSIGFHETQSRIWEVLVGKSLPFWQHFYPKLSEIFPDVLSDVTTVDFYKAVNVVKPTFIRTESDEVTYNLHIIIRYELEKQLINGNLSVQNLEQAWNDHYKEYLGIVPKTLQEGVLQDVHWSALLWGYFPTYTLGNLGAVQLFVQANKDIPNLQDQIRSGDFSELLNWLVTNVHSHGSRYTTNELMELITGRPLQTTDFKNYLEAKYPID